MPDDIHAPPFALADRVTIFPIRDIWIVAEARHMLGSCYECGGDVSSSATFCPHCGARPRETYTPDSKSSNQSTAALIGFTVLGVVAAVLLGSPHQSVQITLVVLVLVIGLVAIAVDRN